MNKVKIFLAGSAMCLLGWALITPPLEFPDEQAHFATVNFYTRERRIPRGNEKDVSGELVTLETRLGTLRDRKGNNKFTYNPGYRYDFTDNFTGRYENEITSLNTEEQKTNYVKAEGAKYPKLYYHYSSFWYGLTYTKNIFVRLFATRIGTVGLSILTLFFSYKIGSMLFNNKRYGIAVSSLVAMQPMMSFVSSGVNSDNLHNMLFTAILASSLSIVKNGLSSKNTSALAISIILDVFTKPQGFIGIPIGFLAVLIRVIKDKKISKSLIYLASAATLIILLTAPQWRQYIGLLTRPNPMGVSLIEFTKFSLNKLYAQNIVWYWGVFKWLGVVLPSWVWRIANRIVLVSGVGLVAYFIKKFKKVDKKLPRLGNTLFLIGAVVIYIASIYWADWQHTKGEGFSLGIQARYYFPTISAQMALLMVGIMSLFSKERHRKIALSTLVLFFAVLQITGLYTLASSYYDTSSVQTFITQASQYKPWFAKGSWWYLWGLTYFAGLAIILKTAIFPNEKNNS